MLVGTRFMLVASAAFGSASLCLAQANDSCSSPDTFAGFGTHLTSTVGATTDGAGSPVCLIFNSDQIHADVWVRWTAQATGLVSFETCGSGFDTRLAVYSGSVCPGESSMIACNDDACTLQSRVTIAANAGQSYMVRIGSYDLDGISPPTGAVTLTVANGALGEIVNPANGHTYVAFTSAGWNSAAAIAQMLGTHLVTIDNAEENEWVRLNFGNLNGVDRRIWIGLTDTAVEGTFAWADGSPVNYTNWNPGEPNNSGGAEDWAELLGSNGRWNDINEAGGSFPRIGLVELNGGGPFGCPADITNDGVVGGADLGQMLSNWGTNGPGGEDLNGDGIVGGADLGALLSAWGPCE